MDELTRIEVRSLVHRALAHLGIADPRPHAARMTTLIARGVHTGTTPGIAAHTTERGRVTVGYRIDEHGGLWLTGALIDPAA